MSKYKSCKSNIPVDISPSLALFSMSSSTLIFSEMESNIHKIISLKSDLKLVVNMSPQISSHKAIKFHSPKYKEPFCKQERLISINVKLC